MKTKIEIKLIKPCSARLLFVKILKDYTDLGLRDAKILCDNLHSNPGVSFKVEIDWPSGTIDTNDGNCVRKFIDDLKECGGELVVNGGTEWLRHYKVLSIGLGDKKEYSDFISNHIYDNRNIGETKELIDFMIDKLSKEEISELFKKIKVLI